MSTAEQEQIIQELRSKATKIKLGEVKGGAAKIDKKAVWAKAKKVGKSIRDDSLSAPRTPGTR
jgi:hypothetical protein